MVVETVPAATVIIVRPTAPTTDELLDAPAHGVEMLMLQRSEVGMFPGMWVFPGGRVDDDDAGDDELARARSAAVREAKEEVDVTVDAASLLTVSQWIPPALESMRRRYSTWFFLALWDGSTPTVDDHEIVAARWISPREALAEGLPMAPPTHVTVTLLAEADSIDALWALHQHRGVELFHSVMAAEAVDGESTIVWAPDVAHGGGDPHAAGPRHRMTIDGVGSPAGSRLTRYERSGWTRQDAALDARGAGGGDDADE